MKLTVEMETGNAAFEDGNSNDEVVRILTRIVKRIENGEDGGKCMDYNGNSVGTWELT